MIRTQWNTKFFDPKPRPKFSPETLAGVRRQVFEQVLAGKNTSRQVADTLGITMAAARKQLLKLVRDSYLAQSAQDSGPSNVQLYRVVQ